MSVPPEPPPAFVILRDGDAAPPRLRRSFVAIGNFDGVHRGHRAVIDAVLAGARAAGVPALALTFEPHPRMYFRPEVPLFRLTPEHAKLRLLAAAGLSGAVVLRFDAVLANLSAEEFVERILVQHLDIGGVAVGADFHFGRKRLGTPEFLRHEGARRGFVVALVPQLLEQGRPLSSGLVRAALAEGRVREATALLGHEWFVEGVVQRGDARGRALGFPTANLALDPTTTLKHGVYAVRVHLGGATYDAVASFGRRPQFDNGAPLLEAFLFGYSGDLYGRSITVEFVDYIRAEAKFPSVEALVAEMERDSAKARAILATRR
jgi:riboflavin kinase/FMN adenylyltransferase